MQQKFQIRVAGEVVKIRPIRPNDIEMEQDFIRRLSPAAKHFRFLCGVSELPVQELRSLCDVDGKNAMAFVATVVRDGHESEIGVARYSPGEGATTREMAVTVSDEWQHRGLGVALVEHLIETAKRNGVTQLYSLDFEDNSAMAALAKDLGMTSAPDPNDRHQVIYSLALNQ
jgi:GNAT superfamily N-acetyltransferase